MTGPKARFFLDHLRILGVHLHPVVIISPVQNSTVKHCVRLMGGNPMKHNKYLGYFFFGTTLFVAVALQQGCGEDPSLYQSEPLAFENTAAIADNTAAKESAQLDLGEDESSDFWLNYYSPWYFPYAPAPLFDYYLEPLPIEVPISPVASIIDYVHPFYAYRHISPFWDGGRRRHHDSDDD
jgi:hypothetical protein